VIADPNAHMTVNLDVDASGANFPLFPRAASIEWLVKAERQHILSNRMYTGLAEHNRRTISILFNLFQDVYYHGS
jgi:hypothetical protein